MCINVSFEAQIKPLLNEATIIMVKAATWHLPLAPVTKLPSSTMLWNVVTVAKCEDPVLLLQNLPAMSEASKVSYHSFHWFNLMDWWIWVVFLTAATSKDNKTLKTPYWWCVLRCYLCFLCCLRIWIYAHYTTVTTTSFLYDDLRLCILSLRSSHFCWCY